jgi:hypothetical protein
MATRPTRDVRVADSTAGTDAVELKVTVSETRERVAADAFGLDSLQGERRQIYFFDNEKLGLFQNGLVLRARQVKGGKDDSTVKIRPVDPPSIGVKWCSVKGFKLEADGVGGRMIRSASLSAEQRANEIQMVARRIRPLRKLFSEEQEAFLAEMMPGRIDLDGLAVLGPVDTLRWRVEHEGLPFVMTAEEWTLPDGRDLLEVSIRVPTAQTAAASAAFDRFLTGLGLRPETGQETKTRVALEFFAKQAAV